MENMTLNVGDTVLFGRDNGEKTLGRVLKVNRVTVKVEQLESRGGFKDHPVGTKWNVARNLCWKQSACAGFLRVEPKPAPVPQDFMKKGRTEAAIMDQIASLYNQLEPENLFADGEISYKDGLARAKKVQAKLNDCFKELGRVVGEFEAYNYGRLP